MAYRSICERYKATKDRRGSYYAEAVCNYRNGFYIALYIYIFKTKQINQ